MNYKSYISFTKFSVWKRKVFFKILRRVSLRPRQSSKGWVLVSYVVHPLIIQMEELQATTHTNPFECLGIVTAFLEQGYSVEVINWDNRMFLPKRNYHCIVDIHKNLERLAPYLSTGCKKALYITGAHWLFQNRAEYARLGELQARRGVALCPRRVVEPTTSIDYADVVFGLGNEAIHQTYAFARKPIIPVQLPAVTTYPQPATKNYEKIRTRFLWIGGGGAVHKGLDLVLEWFASHPEFDLVVCGPVQSEEDFVKVYHAELFETSNIRYVGRINVRGPEFSEIAATSVAVIYPSCSEGTPGSVVTALHAGLIPIVSRESGIDVEPFGYVLSDSSLEAIGDMVKRVTMLSEADLRERSQAAWEYARAHYTLETFYADIQRITMELLSQ